VSRSASGLKAWLVQRLTAVYLALFLTYVVLHLILSPPADHAAWAAWVARPWVSLGFLVCIPLLLAHAWVGIRDVLMDYVKPLGARVGAMAAFALIFLASGLWALQAIYSLGAR
jgi:succinate dehydrogenase / fumarate reductase, membrane anchor subunit